MKISSCHNGSIIVAVSIIMTFMAGCMITSLMATHSLCRLAQARYRYQQQTALLEGLINVGIAYCLEHHTRLFAAETVSEVHIEFAQWPSRELADRFGVYRGSIAVSAAEKKVHITVTLASATLTKAGRCDVYIDDENRAVIHHWSI